MDGGVLPPGCRVLFEDDFDDETTPATYSVINASWDESGGVLAAGPSCSGRIYCREGPAVLHGPAFGVGDGTFAVEYDFLIVGARRGGFSDSWVALHNADSSVIVRTWDGLDRIYLTAHSTFGNLGGQFSLNHVPPDRASDGTGAGTVDRGFSFLDSWHRARIEYRGAGGYAVRLTRLADGSVVHAREDTTRDMSPPVDVSHLLVQLKASGMGHAFDNLRVTQGCPSEL